MKNNSPLILTIALFWVFIFGLFLAQQKSATIPGPCVVHACEECATHADARILMVRYNETAEGHAYCIFRESGQLYIWDYRGPERIDDVDAVTMARMASPPRAGLSVKSAAFEWRSK
jgi:hypothetical protein